MSITTTSATPVNTFLSSLTSSLLSACVPSCSLTLQPAYMTWATNSSLPPLATTVLFVNPSSNQTSTSIDCNTQVLSQYYLNKGIGAQKITGVDDNCNLVGTFPNIEQVKGVNEFYTSSATATYPATYLDIGIRFGAAGIFKTTHANGSSACLTSRNSYTTAGGKTYTGLLTKTTITETSVVAANVTGISTGTYTRTYTLMPQLADYFPDDEVIQQCASYVSFETSPNTLTAANYLTQVRTVPETAPAQPSPNPPSGPEQPAPPPPAESPNQPAQPVPPAPPVAETPTPGNVPQPPAAAPPTTSAGPAPAPTPQIPNNGGSAQQPQPGQTQQSPGIGNLISAIIGVGQGQGQVQPQPTPVTQGSGGVVAPTPPASNNPGGDFPPNNSPSNSGSDNDLAVNQGGSPDSPANPAQSGNPHGNPAVASTPTTLPAVIINGQTALPGGSALVVAGQTVSVDSAGASVAVGTTTVALAAASTAFTNVPGLSVSVTSQVINVPAQLTGAGGAAPSANDIASFIVSGLGGGGAATTATGTVGGNGGAASGNSTTTRPAQYTGAASKWSGQWSCGSIVLFISAMVLIL
ncbi:hypothetical protein B9Z65_1120 [Elsinoe australis]|uniref:Uncharacterized protein n=1 Tax=Elsinoe australis TaxID=40998 RepID=A0A2P8AIC7_9PEZI|nr:hypothetical protein B9Z65_1120 [Elsinoe australis]